MKPRLTLVCAAASAMLVLSACGQKDPKDQVRSAQEYLQKNDLKAAAIEAKSALQVNPDFGEARLVLGRVLAAEGDAAGAELELRKALGAGVSEDEVLPELARSLLAQGQAKKLTDEFGSRKLSQGAAQADLQTLLGIAYAAQGRRDQADAAVAAALAASPDFVPAQIAAARLMAGRQDLAGATAATDAILAKAPASAEAWKLKGDLLLGADARSEEAVAAYRKAIELNPKLLAAHFALITVLVQRSQFDGAAAALEPLQKLAPLNVQTKLFEAQIAFQKQDLKRAREITQQLVRVAPQVPGILQLAGAVELQSNSLVQAEIYLSRALQSAPGLLLARQLLVTTYLRSGQAAKALETLNAAAGKDGLDPQLYSLAGEVYLQNGDAKKAEEYFAKALKLDPENARKRTALAVTHLATGRTEGALEDLQTIASADKGTTADLALISAHLRRREVDKALAAIDRLEAKQPDKPFAANLRGRVQLAKRDAAGARKSFERALTIDPTFYPAIASLASLDVGEKKPEEAKKRFEALLNKNPKHPQALVALAQLAAGSGASKEEVGSLLVRAVEANPTETRPRLLLIDHHLRNRDNKQALAVAQAGVAAAPTSPEMLTALARVQQLSGDLNQAIATYGKVITLQPMSPQAHVRLAEALAASKDMTAAEQSLRKALELKPDMLDVQGALVALLMSSRKYDEAERTARAVQQLRPKEPLGYALQGDVAAVQKRWDDALAAYRAGLKQLPDAVVLATKVHSVMVAAGRTADAERYSAEWLRGHPKDAIFRMHLGDTALAQKNFAAAEKSYQSVIQLQPTNAIALNNLAWVSGQLGRTGAVELAEKAVSLAPQQTAFIDTLAMLLADRKDYSRALELQAKARELAPENNLLRLNLAKIHLKAGNKDEARAELEALAKLGDKFSAQQEVAVLLKGI